jgi:uncharacterized membrane protein
MNALDILNLVCAIGCAVMAGVFFAFSTSVMTALGKVPGPSGIAVMQSINLAIVNPLFLGVFLGTGITCFVAIVACLMHWSLPGMPWMAGGAVLYLGGSFLVTMLCNVPRNNVVAQLDPAEPEAIAIWRDYLTTWTAWNHVRTVASLAASVAFVLRAFLR